MSALHELPEFDWEEIKKHNDKSSLWIVVHDCVYDVTSFQEEHPGGEEVLHEQGGQDASAAFEDVGHSPEARALTDQYRIGTVAGGHAKLPKDIAVAAPPENTSSRGTTYLLLILALIFVAIFVFYQLTDNSDIS